ncbi:MAG TPA: sugar phosphate isomerase/epimerase [Longimicrobiales bacterium]|nr:sugar phosphate isomerase/epimerase [Longimicrobiales bacterium]
MQRRKFLGALGALGLAGAAGGMVSPRMRGNGGAGPGIAGTGGPHIPSLPGMRPAPGSAAAPGGLPEQWGVQLYTVRGAMAESVPATLEAVAAMGYGEVEFAGLFGHSPVQVRSLLDSLGLRAASCHVGMDVIRGPWEAALDDAATLGQDLIVLPSLPGDARTADGLKALAEELSRAGEAARARGLHLGFHNHDFEVTPLAAGAGGDGSPASRPLDLLLAHSDAATVSFQMDLFWVVHGGADPLAYFRDHPGRFLSVHVKDRSADGRMVDVGAGSLDFRSLLQAGEAAGVRHAFVEHDNPEEPMASIRAGIRHLQTLRD